MPDNFDDDPGIIALQDQIDAEARDMPSARKQAAHTVFNDLNPEIISGGLMIIEPRGMLRLISTVQSLQENQK